MLISRFSVPNSPLIGPAYAPAEGMAVKSICLMLHGFSGNGDLMIQNAPKLARSFPNTLFVAPNGPGPSPLGFSTRNWFLQLEHTGPGDIAVRAAGARPILEHYISSLSNMTGIATRKLTVLGFSQGGLMALELGLRSRVSIPRIISHSGLLPDPSRLRQSLRQRPRVLLTHGTEDVVIPHSEFEVAEAALRHSRLRLETLSQPGVGHWITGLAWRETARFMAPVLN